VVVVQDSSVQEKLVVGILAEVVGILAVGILAAGILAVGIHAVALPVEGIHESVPLEA